MFKVIFVTFILLYSQYGIAKKLTVAFGSTLAPWVIAEQEKGILIDLFSEAMAPLGYDIEKLYYPYARRIASYQAQHVDVVCDINLNDIHTYNLGGYFSGDIYTYENYAYSLKQKNYHFEKISELSDYSLLSWQGARKQLGEAYDTMAENNPEYTETHNQRLQVEMLFKERVEIIQMDKNIFSYYRNNLIDKNPHFSTLEYERFALFGQNPNGFMFRSSKVRDDFVKQIKVMLTDGRFDKIFQQYTL